MSFCHKGSYRCSCGKEYTNSQAYNGHLSRCRIHLGDKKFNERNKKLYESVAIGNIKRGKREKEKNDIVRKNELDKWISEKHKCENCGKIMNEYFGSGRFCSTQCARSFSTSHNRLLNNYKTGNTLRIRNGSAPISISEYLSNLIQKIKRQYNKKDIDDSKFYIIPKVSSSTKNKCGYPSRKNKYSYPEKFWKRVFENNNIPFKHSVYVHNEFYDKRSGAYEIDFLIDNKYDIEIDGGLHKKKHIKEKDKRRDTYLQSLGYVIYRIPWVNPNSLKNKEIVYNQIVNLFKFLGKNLITNKNQIKEV